MTLINGHNIYVENHGPEDGRPVVLLHHGLGSTRAWRRQIPALTAAGYRLIVYDRWGYGKSDARANFSPPEFEQDINDLSGLLDHYAVEQTGLVGHSDGGTIALYYAAQFPQQVSCLVTVAAHIYLEPKMGPGMQGILDAVEHDARSQKGLKRAHGDKLEGLVKAWYDGWLTPEALSWDMRPSLAKVVCPTLVIQGEDDEHTTPQHARDIAVAIPNAELWLVPGAPHMLPKTIKEQFNHRLITFLNANLEQSS
jgi:pimeloyl-ACP methyl ester carboxylesterase